MDAASSPTPAANDRQRLELLASAGNLLSRSLEPSETLQAIARTVVPAVADWCRVDLFDRDGVLRRALTYHSDPAKTRHGSELVNRLRAAPGAVGSMEWVTQTGKPFLAHFDRPGQHDPVRDRDLLTFAHEIGMRAYFMVPLIARGRTLGALGALQAESGRDLSPEDCSLISELGQRAALALDNARLYADAESALKQAQTANRAKDEFLAMLGHELRNPLAPIVTALQLMQLRSPNAAEEERRIIERQVAHLSRLVDDLLDVSRITKGKITLQRELVDIKSVVGRALEITQPALERRARPVELSLPPHEVQVLGDAVRLAQVVSNLLTNAAKFTPPDRRIALRVAVHAGEVELSVEDAGAGIAAELLPRVFDLFVQGAQPSDRTSGGLGLGLTIVRSLVEMHGGRVAAESAGPGRGAAFRVRLPAAAGAARKGSASPARLPRVAAGTRVLVVDDNADALDTLAALLRMAGYEVHTAADAAAAREVVASLRPQIAVLDIGLPGTDGYELARQLRADTRAADLRLVALTGYGSERDRARALASSFDEHLVKPVEAERLFATLQGLLAR